MVRSVIACCVLLPGLLGQPAAAQDVSESPSLTADEASPSDPREESEAAPRPRSWIVLPHLYYTPETGLAGGGVVGFYPGGGLAARPTSVLSSVTVTAHRQLVAEVLPELYLAEGRVWVSAKLRAMKYPDVFYGIGHGTTPEMEEDFTSRGFALELQAQREMARGSWLGLRTQVQTEDLLEVEEDRLLATGRVTGAAGGRVVGVGVVATRDTRNHAIAPRNGVLAEVKWTGFAPALGSDYRFALLGLDARAYTPVAGGVLAMRARADAAQGAAPFTLLPKLGGSRLLRGYREGRYRDDLAATLEAEYRFPIVWRFGGVVFGGLGDVASGPGDLSPAGDLQRAAGAGLRFRLNQAGVNIRVDWARGRETGGLYIGLGEAY